MMNCLYRQFDLKRELAAKFLLENFDGQTSVTNK